MRSSFPLYEGRELPIYEVFMFALQIDDNDTVISSFRCSLDEYRKFYKTIGYYWVDYTGFLNPNDIQSFLVTPERFVFIKGEHDYNGFVVGVSLDNYVKPIINQITISQTNPTVVVPEGITVLLIRYLIAAGGAGGIGKGGQGASIRNTYFYVNKGDILTLEGSVNGALYNGDINSDQPSGGYLRLTLNGNVISSVLGGTGSSKADVNQTVTHNSDYDWHRGAGGRWITTPGVLNAQDGQYETSDSVYQTFGGGGDIQGNGQDGYVDLAFLNDSALHSTSIYNPSIPVLKRASYPKYDPALLSYSVNTIGPAGFGFTIPEDYYYAHVKMMCAGGGAGSNYSPGGTGSHVKDLYYHVMPGYRLFGAVGAGGTFNGDGNTSQRAGSLAELYVSDGSVTLNLLTLLGGTGGSKGDGINELTPSNWRSGAGGLWNTTSNSVIAPHISDGSDQSIIPLKGRSDFGEVITVGTGGTRNNDGIAGYVNITLLQSLEGENLEEGSPIISANSPDTITRNLDFSYKLKQEKSFNTPGLYADRIPSWARYMSIDFISAGGGAGSHYQKGGCGAYLNGPIYLEVDPNAEVSYLIGEGGKVSSGTTLPQMSGKPSGIIYEGHDTVILGGGVGGGGLTGNGTTQQLTSVNNHYEMYLDDKRWTITLPGGDGGDWQRSIDGLPITKGNSQSSVSYIANYGGGGDLSMSGQSGYLKVTYLNALPGDAQSRGHLSDVTGDNTYYPTSTETFTTPLTEDYTTPGVYYKTVPNGCYYMAIEQAIAGGGAGGQVPLNNNIVTGGCGAYAQQLGFLVTPGDTIRVEVGKGGVYNHLDNTPQQQGGNTTISLLITSDETTSSPTEILLLGLGGGVGSGDWTGINQNYISPTTQMMINRNGGEGGEMYYHFAGHAVDGYANSDSSQITGYGGGGTQASNGQDGYVKLSFLTQEPSNPPYSLNDTTQQTGTYSPARTDLGRDYSFIQYTDITYAIIPLRHYTHFRINYLCSGGGMGSKAHKGGQGAVAMGQAYFKLGESPVLYISVGKGGDENHPDGINSIISYSDRTTPLTILAELVGGFRGSDTTISWTGTALSPGHGGFATKLHPALNVINGVNQSSVPISSFGQCGGGGDLNQNGQPGFVDVTFFENPSIQSDVSPALAPNAITPPTE